MEPSRIARGVALAASLLTFAVTSATTLGQVGDRPGIRTLEVSSYWDEVPMRCRTTKVELGDEDVEWFRCRETGAVRAPPGRYRDEDTVWYSDVDGRPAVQHDIVISPSGALTGWARYR